jgi:hypothetical protein
MPALAPCKPLKGNPMEEGDGKSTVCEKSQSDRSQISDSEDGEMSAWLSAYAAKPVRRDISP